MRVGYPEPIEIQRARLGLSTPIPEEKLLVWSQLSVPQAGILKERGGYKPFSITRQAHFHPARNKMINGGIRGSKSVSTSMEGITWAPHSDLMWLGGENYDHCRQEFEYIMEAALSLGWTTPARVNFPDNKFNSCSIEFNWGTYLETKSLRDPNTFMARAPDWVGICEPGQTSMTAVYRAKERTSTRRGELWMGGTFEDGAPWMDELWKKWRRWDPEDNGKAWTSPTYINSAVFPKGKLDPEYLSLRRNADLEGTDVWLRRLVGVPGSVTEVIFSKEWRSSQHIRPTPYRRKNDFGVLLPVYAAIDPGYGGGSYYVVLSIQIIGNKVRVIGEDSKQGHTHEQMKDLCMIRPWWPVMKAGTIDPYAGDSHVYGSVSPKSVWAQDTHGGRVDLDLPKRVNVDELIRLIKSFLNGLAGYDLEIDPSCERLIFEMKNWKRKKDKNGILGAPSDKQCDAIKALGYFLVQLSLGLIGVREREPEIQVVQYNLAGAGNVIDPVLLVQQEAERFQGASEWLQ